MYVSTKSHTESQVPPERRGRTKWPDMKSHKIRSAASRSRRIMIILDKLFICQLKLNLLYSTSRISETTQTRNDRWAPWSKAFGHSKFQNATAKNVAIMFSDTMTLYVHSGKDESHLAPDCEICSRSSAPTRSVGHYDKRFCTGNGRTNKLVPKSRWHSNCMGSEFLRASDRCPLSKRAPFLRWDTTISSSGHSRPPSRRRHLPLHHPALQV
jgi:hypothetical protein